MKVKDLISELKECNQEAEVNVIAHCKVYQFSICCGNAEGCTYKNADTISFYVDELCTNERTEEMRKLEEWE